MREDEELKERGKEGGMLCGASSMNEHILFPLFYFPLHLDAGYLFSQRSLSIQRRLKYISPLILSSSNSHNLSILFVKCVSRALMQIYSVLHTELVAGI